MDLNLASILSDAFKRRPARGGPGLEITLGDRGFPHSYRPSDAAEPELPEVFRTLPDAILMRLPFRAATTGPDGMTKEKLFDLYHESVENLRGRYADCAKLLVAVVVCGIEVRGHWSHDKRVFEAMKSKFQEWRERLPAFDFQPPPVLSLDLYKRSVTAIVPQLYFALSDAGHRLVKKLADALDRLVDLELVGLIEWQAEDACQYHFFRNVLLGELGAKRTATTHEVREFPGVRSIRREKVERTTATRRPRSEADHPSTS